MERAAAEPSLGPLRDPLPDGIEIAQLLRAVGELQAKVGGATASRGGVVGAVRASIRRVLGRPAEVDTALLASVEALFDAVAALNHLVGTLAARLVEHEERLGGVEVRAAEPR
jgi:hypothetical protein